MSPVGNAEETLAVARPSLPVVGLRHGARDYVTRRVLALGDALALVTAFALAGLLAGGFEEQHLLWSLASIPVWIIIFRAYGLYDRDAKRVSHTTIDDVPWLFHAMLVAFLALWVLFNAIELPSLPLSDSAILVSLAVVSVISGRCAVRSGLIRFMGSERVLVVGQGDSLSALVRKMRSHPEYRLEPIGVVGMSTEDAAGVTVPTLATLDSVDLSELVKAQQVDRVVLSHTGFDGTQLLEFMRECKLLRVRVNVVPQLFAAMGPSVEVDDVEGVTVLSIDPPVLPRYSRLTKRAVDIIGAAGLFLVAWPVLLVAAIAIKLDSRGPVLFRQTRIGKGDERFQLVKFRTMVTGAEGHQETLRAGSRDGGWLLLDHDPRVTKVGRLLRLSSLDELPQLWNVLKGEMSLFGPRPLIESEASQLAEWERTRIDLTPGLTGLWQVLGRTNIPFDEMLKLDYLYVTNWSLWGDFRLMVKTLPAVLTRKGAN
jgi:exopolysaccharide biosynthesis polyprenyl glycosylphosphotransferase